jgi:hypothetical protein
MYPQHNNNGKRKEKKRKPGLGFWVVYNLATQDKRAGGLWFKASPWQALNLVKWLKW